MRRRQSQSKHSSLTLPNVQSTMKTLSCDLCDYEASGETFEAWMEALKPHYMKDHSEVMKDPSKTKEDMEKWMVENKTRFEEA